MRALDRECLGVVCRFQEMPLLCVFLVKKKIHPMSILRNTYVPRQQIFCRPTRIGKISHSHVSLLPVNCYDMVKRTDPSSLVQFPVGAGSIKGLGTAKSIYLGFDPLLCTLLPSVLPSVSSTFKQIYI